MAEKFFVDTNILVYAHDRTAAHKHERATEVLQRLWDDGSGILSTQVLQELCVNLRRKVSPPIPFEEIRQLIEDYLSWHVITNTPESTIRALEIQQRYKISFWDALLLHAAETSGAAVLYSEDLAAGQRYNNIRVVNPLV